MARRAGRKRDINAKRRSGARALPVGPTPEMARAQLAATGAITPEEAWGLAALPLPEMLKVVAEDARLLREGASRDLKGRLAHLRRLGDARFARGRAAILGGKLDDEEVLRRWWATRPTAEVQSPLDLLAVQNQTDPERGLSEMQRTAGARLCRLYWQVFGLPVANVEAVYRRAGLVTNAAGSVKSKPSEEREEETETTLRVALSLLAVEHDVETAQAVAEVCVYRRPPPSLYGTAEEQAADRSVALLRRGLTTLVKWWGIDVVKKRRRPPSRDA